MKAPKSEQQDYELGYDNPLMPPGTVEWLHAVQVTAFLCGQEDSKNRLLRAAVYRREDYLQGGVRRASAVSGDDDDGR